MESTVCIEMEYSYALLAEIWYEGPFKGLNIFWVYTVNRFADKLHTASPYAIVVLTGCLQLVVAHS